MAVSIQPPTLIPTGNLSATGFVSIILAFFVFAIFYSIKYSNYPLLPGIPVVGLKADERTIWSAQQRWFEGAKEMTYNGLKSTKGAFQVIAGSGPMIILPSKYVKEVMSNEEMTFKSWLKKEFFTSYPGFQGFNPSVVNDVFISSVRYGLTHSLAKIIPVLADETKLSLKAGFPRSDDWEESQFDEASLRLIGRLSARTFLPEPVCHDDEWLRITVEYTVNFFTAAYVLRAFPAFTRPFLHWVLPHTRKLRHDYYSARNIIAPVVKERERMRKAGQELPDDALEWAHITAQKSGQYADPVDIQLNYTLGAVHTTTLTFVAVFYNILANPEYVDLLRAEIVSVLNEGAGWSKQTMSRLRLMDSVMRESNRLHPSTLMVMNRVADRPQTFHDGLHIPKGATITLLNTGHVNEELYPNVEKFDGHRFLDERQFVSTEPDYLPFGHGKHACPGRFFASNEIKVLLCHLLLGYDWKYPEGQGRPAVNHIGLDRTLDPTVKILYKARTPEVPLVL